MARRRKKLRIGRIFILILLITSIFVLGYMAITKNNKNEVKKARDISEIKEFGYTLREDATSYYKSLYKKLSKTLEGDIDYDKYSSLVSQMFVCDFFTLSNKSNKNDVGGFQFVYSEYKNDFQKYAADTVYKSVLNNVYGNRKQDLPTVKEVNVTKKDNTAFKYGDSTDEGAYVYDFEITYDNDYGYQDSGSLTLIHNGKKIEVAKMSEK